MFAEEHWIGTISIILIDVYLYLWEKVCSEEGRRLELILFKFLAMKSPDKLTFSQHRLRSNTPIWQN